MKKPKKKKEKDNKHGLTLITPASGHAAGGRRAPRQDSCRKCGKCCTGGSPVLLKEDLPLFTSGILSYDNTYTVREGEVIRSYGEEDLYESPAELIKIRGKAGTAACIFYGGNKGCGIYENRPAQCRIYKCWIFDEALTGIEDKRLTRRELFSTVDVLLDVIEKHEEKCSYRRLSEAFEKLSKGDEHVVEDIFDMLQYDTYVRPFLGEKFNIPAGAMELLLGRPLVNTINGFGFKVVNEGEEYTLLPTDKPTDKPIEEGE